MSQQTAIASSRSRDISQSDPLMPLSLPILIGITGMVLFVVSQMLVVTGLAIWAIGGYFHLHLIGFSILIALASIPVGLASWKVLIMAIAAERDPANN